MDAWLALDRKDVTPRSPMEMAREEQAHYQQFWQPAVSRSVWKVIAPFLAPPFAALTAAMALLALSMH
jgi:hypothetical protein